MYKTELGSAFWFSWPLVFVRLNILMSSSKLRGCGFYPLLWCYVIVHLHIKNYDSVCQLLNAFLFLTYGKNHSSWWNGANLSGLPACGLLLLHMTCDRLVRDKGGPGRHQGQKCFRRTCNNFVCLQLLLIGCVAGRWCKEQLQNWQLLLFWKKVGFLLLRLWSFVAGLVFGLIGWLVLQKMVDNV